MGKPQGDGLPEPTYYEREVDGEVYRRPAHVPADHVNLQARGWTKAQDQAAAARPAGAAKPVGSHKRVTAQVVPGNPAAADAGEQANG